MTICVALALLEVAILMRIFKAIDRRVCVMLYVRQDDARTLHAEHWQGCKSGKDRDISDVRGVFPYHMSQIPKWFGELFKGAEGSARSIISIRAHSVLIRHQFDFGPISTCAPRRVTCLFSHAKPCSYSYHMVGEGSGASETRDVLTASSRHC